MEQFDLVILGAGPGGYIAATYAASLGMKVACIEKQATLGGTCLNVGCIPSKALLHSTELFYYLKHHAKDHGITTSTLHADLTTMMEKKQNTVSTLVKGLDHLFEKRKIARFQGEGIVAQDHVQVAGQKIGFNKLILATGSTPIELPQLPFDEKQILSSTGALALTQVPKTLLLVGAGVIGLELGSVFARLGAQVQVVELMDRIVPPFDVDISQSLLPIFKQQGFMFYLSNKVTECIKHPSHVVVKTDKDLTLQGDVVLVAVGRRACVPTGMVFATLPSGHLQVDSSFQTSVPNIYAIGDLVDGPMLAHKASEEALVLVEALAGNARPLDYLTIPNVMYTNPEVASVGISEAKAQQWNLTITVGKASFKGNSRARASGQTEGFVKMIADKNSGRLLGIHIIGAQASELIAEAVTCLKNKMTAQELAFLPHAHPTLSEILKEAAFACLGKPLHG